MYAKFCVHSRQLKCSLLGMLTMHKHLLICNLFKVGDIMGGGTSAGMPELLVALIIFRHMSITYYKEIWMAK